MSEKMHVAESVLMGHPDRLADSIAERIVDWPMRSHGNSLVGVEVAVHRDMVHITGRVRTSQITGGTTNMVIRHTMKTRGLFQADRRIAGTNTD